MASKASSLTAGNWRMTTQAQGCFKALGAGEWWVREVWCCMSLYVWVYSCVCVCVCVCACVRVCVCVCVLGEGEERGHVGKKCVLELVIVGWKSDVSFSVPRVCFVPSIFSALWQSDHKLRTSNIWHKNLSNCTIVLHMNIAPANVSQI